MRKAPKPKSGRRATRGTPAAAGSVEPDETLPPETAATPSPSPSDGAPVRVQLRTPETAFDVPTEISGRLAMQWYYRVRNRQRWTDSFAARQSLAERALGELDAIGVSKSTLGAIGKAGAVEVSIPFYSEADGWAARILPWEFLLRSATGKQDLTVIRHMDVQQGTSTPSPGKPSKLLFVKCAPGPLAEYSFEREECLVKGSFGLANAQQLEDPSALELTEFIQQAPPEVIHLAGFDVHQGDEIRSQSAAIKDGTSSSSEDMKWDGMYLAGDTPNDIVPISAEMLGAALNPVTPRGALVTFNMYHSAARLAAMAVAKGSAAAIGFQDVVDDELAERFFACFFQQYRTLDWNLAVAFDTAWRRVGVTNQRDTGVVLWSRNSLIQQLSPSIPRKQVEVTALKIGARKGEVFKVRVDPITDINYSLLHNGQGLFNTFRFEKYEPQYAHGIKVDVALNMGTDSFSYQATFDLEADDPLLDISAHVNLPLTSQLARSLREDVLTSLRVCVSYEAKVLYEETKRVKLLAINQWCFDRRQGARWLASFVLPGDPVVPQIRDAAQKYLMALRDDPAAGFDGYQSTDPTHPESADEGVDMQVRAIWAAISFDSPLNYINPPPVFTQGSQRVRTPSDILKGRAGTCIDLALMFAACLEYVDIYPVLFVLTDHAFPGYWRSEQSYQEFLTMQDVPDFNEGYGDYDASALTQKKLRFEEVRQFVRDGKLVPLETVWLTAHRGFSEAVDAGIDNLRSSSSFEAMVNIRKLRDQNVTPLPISGEFR